MSNTNIDKEKTMREMLDTLQKYRKEYEKTMDRDLVNIYLGQLHGFEIFFNIVSVKGIFTVEASKLLNDFKKEIEEDRQIFSKKIEELAKRSILY